MGKFFEKYKLFKLILEEIDNLNSPISIKEIQFLIKDHTHTS